MKPEDIKYVYLLGIGGIGMSALARYFNAHGKKVSGYDRARTSLTDELVAEGIAIHFDENIEAIPNEIKEHPSKSLIIYTPAVPKEHKELVFFRENNFELKKRSEVLGTIAKNYHAIAVAGTHGKTTTSSLIAHILTHSGSSCTAFLGGVTQNYNTNLLLDTKADTMVVEADEYDRSFLTLFPDIAVITSMDADHLDIYGSREYVEESYRLFASQVKENGKLIYKKGLAVGSPVAAAYTYSISERADFYAENIHVEEGEFIFDFISEKESIKDIHYGIPGRHNIENAVAASAVAQFSGVNAERIKEALRTFKGVRRRFEYHIKSNDLIFIDDYAHHPAELKACISAVKELYPDKRITGIFQPHLFTRTRDFTEEFVQALNLLDECILLEIYPAREVPIPGVTSQMLLDKISNKNKKLLQKSELVNYLRAYRPQVLLTLGAGDIDQLVEPVKRALSNA